MAIIDDILNSRSFEKNTFFLRRKIPSLNKKYNYIKGINYRSLNSNYISDIESLIDEAKKSLYEVKKIDSFLCKETKFVSKNIWLYWNDSSTSLPSVVKESIDSWSKLNPQYKVTFLHDENLNDILGFDFNAIFRLSTVNMGVAMKADILRLYLLCRYGGVWADSTTFCLKPLDDWLPEATNSTSFFTFRHPNNCTRPIEAWFIAAKKNHPVIREVLMLLLEHLFKRRDVSLYVSNRIKIVGMRDNDSKKFTLDVIKLAEEKGFMPYFSISYCFNEVLKNESYKGIYQVLNKKTNRHASNYDDFSDFSNAYVSKQTYKKDYQNSDIYKRRVRYLHDILKNY